MAEQRADERGQGQERAVTTLKRRGVMAAAAAMVAGIVATRTSQSVSAENLVSADEFIATGANQDGFIAGGNANSNAGFTTSINASYGYGVYVSGTNAGVQGTSTSGYGVHGIGTGNDSVGVRGEAPNAGVIGVATTGYGVQGTSSGSLPGVYGSNGNGNNAIGVQGDTGGSSTGAGVLGGRMNVSGNPFNGIGVLGRADGGHGVHGDAASGNGVVGTSGGGTNTAGVYGSGVTYGVYGTAGGGNGVTGISTGGGGTGVYAKSASGYGVYSTTGATDVPAVYGLNSSSGTGIIGKTTTGLYGVVGYSGSSQGSAGLLGVANGPNAVGFGTVTQGGATFAGYFNGTTVVNGAFAVTGAKSAAVKDAAGDYRLMYSVESPEAWFEDFGTGTLANGAATVKIDPLFAQHIHADGYHVFLSPHDAEHTLTATTRAVQSFTVQGSPSTDAAAKGKKASDLNGTFSYRIVAKRNDIAGERLAKFTMPPTLVAPEVPPVPTTRPSGPSASDASAPAPLPTAAPTVQAAPAGKPAPLPPSR